MRVGTRQYKGWQRQWKSACKKISLRFVIRNKFLTQYSAVPREGCASFEMITSVISDAASFSSSFIKTNKQKTINLRIFLTDFLLSRNS